ncbi:hypothetical protein C8F01DRAFT_1256122 [Mycena amicta]|nr:hypothetical protein C8F01DRAFT_1256122 [Mycena amicta]
MLMEVDLHEALAKLINPSMGIHTGLMRLQMVALITFSMQYLLWDAVDVVLMQLSMHTLGRGHMHLDCSLAVLSLGIIADVFEQDVFKLLQNPAKIPASGLKITYKAGQNHQPVFVDPNSRTRPLTYGQARDALYALGKSLEWQNLWWYSLRYGFASSMIDSAPQNHLALGPNVWMYLVPDLKENRIAHLPTIPTITPPFLGITMVQNLMLLQQHIQVKHGKNLNFADLARANTECKLVEEAMEYASAIFERYMTLATGTKRSSGESSAGTESEGQSVQGINTLLECIESLAEHPLKLVIAQDEKNPRATLVLWYILFIKTEAMAEEDIRLEDVQDLNAEDVAPFGLVVDEEQWQILVEELRLWIREYA